MFRYYLGIPVKPIGEPEDGWQWAVWPDGRKFKHWADQLREEPWA
jgi:hypothetical protein